MAFLKYAHANVVKPDIHLQAWDRVRHQAQALGSAFDKQGSKILLAEYHPKDYLLTHCTIVASVNTEAGPGSLGRQVEGGFEVNRLYSDYYITPETTPWINNNNDAWSRPLLLASYRTFIGGSNFVEHLQIPEMNKGRIIDAVARDIGPSVYTDILVATARKHRPLISAIQAKQLNTLSMGANVMFTICSKCGNVAYDETQLCHHIKYEKGNTFIDAMGKTRKVAELCGHVSAEPGSNIFKEASWVANPAFTGAVLHEILSPEEAEKYGPSLHTAFALPIPKNEPGYVMKAAFDLGQGQEEEFDGAGDSEKKEAPKDDSISKAVSDLTTYLRDQVVQQVRKDLDGKKDAPANLDENLNNTLIREASRNPQWRRIALTLNQSIKDPGKTRRLVLGLLHYKRGGWKAVRASNLFSGREILAISRVLDTVQGVPKVAGEARIYRTVLAVGGSAPYGNADVYLTACRRVLGRELTTTERESLVVKGKLFDLGQ